MSVHLHFPLFHPFLQETSETLCISATKGGSRKPIGLEFTYRSVSSEDIVYVSSVYKQSCLYDQRNELLNRKVLRIQDVTGISTVEQAKEAVQSGRTTVTLVLCRRRLFETTPIEQEGPNVGPRNNDALNGTAAAAADNESEHEPILQTSNHSNWTKPS